MDVMKIVFRDGEPLPPLLGDPSVMIDVEIVVTATLRDVGVVGVCEVVGGRGNGVGVAAGWVLDGWTVVGWTVVGWTVDVWITVVGVLGEGALGDDGRTIGVEEVVMPGEGTVHRVSQCVSI